MVELWTSHARKQLEVLSEQLTELTALGRKMASESAGPIARSVGQIFNSLAERCGRRGTERSPEFSSVHLIRCPHARAKDERQFQRAVSGILASGVAAQLWT